MVKSNAIFLSVLLFFTARAEKVLLNADFRSGSAGPATVTGGKFSNGWQQVSPNRGERIVFKTPAPITKGYAEVTFTLDQFGTSFFSSDKNIYFSVYRSQQLAQRAAGGHYAYVRIRKEESRNYFVEFKAYTKAADESEGETRVCCRDDWKKYIGKQAVMRFTWSDAANVMLTYPDPSGSGSKTATRPHKVNGINYIVVGAENSYNASVYCFRYLSLKVVSLDSSTPVVFRAEQGSPDAAVSWALIQPEFGGSGSRSHRKQFRIIDLSGRSPSGSGLLSATAIPLAGVAISQQQRP